MWLPGFVLICLGLDIPATADLLDLVADEEEEVFERDSLGLLRFLVGFVGAMIGRKDWKESGFSRIEYCSYLSGTCKNHGEKHTQGWQCCLVDSLLST